MIKPAPIRRRVQPSEEGYILVWVICLLALFTISLAIALPKVSKEIQRDREIETMHRGKQYARAVKMYYKKFGAYPPNLDALAKPTNNIRFLRKKYVDPTTGKEEWKPVLFGQNKAPTAMGFFGQPLAGSTMAGIGPGAAGNGLTGSTGLSGASGLTGGGGGLFQQTPDSSATQTQDPNNPSGGTGGTGAIGSTTGSAFGSTTGSAFGSTTGSTTGLSGQTFGGAGIIGFSPTSPKQSILVYKKKTHYNEWEFVYDPLSEQVMMGGNTGAIGQPASSTTTPIGGSPGVPSPSPSPAPVTTTPQQ
jgi:type II secretory pathway pseudopilin PulG